MLYKKPEKGERIFNDALLDQVLWMNSIYTKEKYFEEIESMEDKIERLGVENVSTDFPFELDTNQKFFEALERNLRKKIVIVGDYDVDGVSATAIAYKYLTYLGANFDWIIPNRFVDGYGLKQGMVDKAIEKGAEVILTVDNGIKSKHAIEYAVSKGVPVLVTDHHQPDVPNFPHDAEVIVNPHVGNEGLKFKEICGATVIFQLFYHHLKRKGASDLEIRSTLADSYDIVAVATVADVMPMKHANRTLVQSFVKRVRKGKVFNVGIKKMIEAQSINPNTFSSLDIGFLIGPLVNAPGRLVSADIGVEILTSPSGTVAKKKADEANKKNSERKDKTLSLKEIAFAKINENDGVHVIYIPEANEGLIGITSGQITEKFGKPSFVFTDSEGGVKGSGRSPLNFDLISAATKVLEANPEWALGYGGHPGAMGLSLKDANALRGFKKEMNRIYRELDPKTLIKPYIGQEVFEVRSFEEIAQKLKKLEPYGEEFQYPLFQLKGEVNEIRHLGKRVGPNKEPIKDHTMFRISGMDTKFLWFKNILPTDCVGKKYEIFFQINESEFRGETKFDAFVKDLIEI